jgi:hypothetical protein
MFLLNGKRLQEGTAFEDAEGNKYPPQWLNQTTLEQKEAIGITEVPDPAPLDTRFYWDYDLPKAMEDKVETDEQGNTSTTIGLKTQFIEQTKQTMNSLLNPTDWMIVRQYERQIEIPANVVQFRSDVVVKQSMLESAIIASNTVEELIEILNAQNWPNLEGTL